MIAWLYLPLAGAFSAVFLAFATGFPTVLVATFFSGGRFVGGCSGAFLARVVAAAGWAAGLLAAGLAGAGLAAGFAAAAGAEVPATGALLVAGFTAAGLPGAFAAGAGLAFFTGVLATAGFVAALAAVALLALEALAAGGFAADFAGAGSVSFLVASSNSSKLSR